MPTYVIGYDLNDPGQDYDDLFDAIKDYGTWWHHLDSTWIIRTTDSASEIRDNLKQYKDSNDELLVVKLSVTWASSGINSDGADWLHDHL